MRSHVHVRSVSRLLKTSALVGISVFVTACSNDAVRFDDLITTGSTLTANQQAIIKNRAPVSQPYPGDLPDEVDEVSTSSVTSDGIRVAARSAPTNSYERKPLAPAVKRAPLAAPSVTSYHATKTITQPVKEKAVQAVTPEPVRKVVTAARQPIVLAPRTATKTPLLMTNTDAVTTGSVTRNAPVEPVSRREGGWTKTGGSWIMLKSGETLYNLSRRFGVPVTAIMSANNIADASSVQSGTRILIPTYQHGASVPVSAPDNNPITHASRASTGFQGQVRGRVPVPKARVQNTFAPSLSAPSAPVSTQPILTTGQRYTVQPGDTLSGIARRHGVSAAQLRSANSMTSDVVRLGSSLAIPAGGLTVASNTKDPITTSSVPTGSKVLNRTTAEKTIKPAYTSAEESVSIANKSREEVKTAAATSAGTFRWPAKGRIITKFGERIKSGSNDGIDISLPIGTSIKASENGTVIYSGSELEDFGKLILVSHSGGWVSAYAHASSTLVKRGDKVTRGQTIAKSGRSGNATVPKLHFELRKNSTPVDPLKHLGAS